MKKILLTRLWDKFISIVLAYLEKENMTQQELADLVGMQRSHLNALLNKSPGRPLSAYYLLKFIRVGVVKVSQIYDKKATDEREVDFWKQAKEAANLKLLAKIARIREKGIDIDKFLDLHFPKV